MKIWTLRILGFLLGGFVGIFVADIVASLTDRIAVLMAVIPIMSGIGGSYFLIWSCYSQNSFGARLVRKFWNCSSIVRALLVAPVFWIACVGAFIWLFEPYGGYMSSSDFSHMYKVMVFPPLLLGAGCSAYFKLIKPKTTGSTKET
ncbi:hypothetical protein [Marinobacter salarius]|jgi:uncharacterized membrane protein YuzA (DUF378 family)|uniref:hypothetical protein n=1 Tax=Marinobacter salarius TaxID=1420917 RepID=UPI001A165EB9|nr:hypothetical protein [Marinobacter salarius]HIO29937.1 hypothetical protein [Marinobacter salarius]HIP00302.1 hypothetical protein [Marinobacter salarius]